MKSKKELQKIVKRHIKSINNDDLFVVDNLYVIGVVMATIVTQSMDDLEEVREYCDYVKSMCLDIATQRGLE